MLAIDIEASVYRQWISGAKDPVGILLRACVSNDTASAAFYEPTADQSWLELLRGYPEQNWGPAILSPEWGGLDSDTGYLVQRGDRQWAVIPVYKNATLLGAFISDDVTVLAKEEQILRMIQTLYVWAESTPTEIRWKFAEKSIERWLVVEETGICWWNDPLYAWMGGSPVAAVTPWPQWVAPDAVVCRADFWAALTKSGSWTGPVGGSDPQKPMWWQFSRLDRDKYLVRIHTYEEMASNPLAKTHWQTHDPVTGLPRQNTMVDAWRMDGSPEWGFAVWSIDNFQEINSTHGMLLGDRVLEATANMINRYLPPGWHLWRGRAETFYAIGPACSQSNDWYSQTLTLDVLLPGIEDIHCSLGLSVGCDYKACLLAALEALEFTQENGGHQAAWNSNERRLRTPNAIAAEVAVLDPSVSCNIVYLPVMTTSEPQRIQAFDALLRWNHPTWGVLTPDTFWREAEKTGAIHRLGPWMIKTLFNQIQAWQSMGHQAIEVHANVSAAQIQNPNFTDFLTDAARDFKWNGARLLLEIPERDISSCIDALRQSQSKWNDLGIGLVIDEWGVGQTANVYLSELSIDRIKLSSALVHSLHSTKQRHAVRGAVGWLHYCGYSVIADGVESTEHKQWIAEIGCDAYQGYLNTRDRKVVRWKR